jgi:hypothetical protein
MNKFLSNFVDQSHLTMFPSCTVSIRVELWKKPWTGLQVPRASWTVGECWRQDIPCKALLLQAAHLHALPLFPPEFEMAVIDESL